MAWTLLAHCGGSPGVTTTALGLALTWPGQVLLVDADPHPSQSVLAGYLKGLPAGGRGLAGMAQQYRANPSTRIKPTDHAVMLDVDRPSCRFLPGFNHPGQARLFEPFWSRLAGDLVDVDGDLLIDCGRLGADGPPRPLSDHSRQVLLVLRPTLAQIAVTRCFLNELRNGPEGLATPIGLVVIGSCGPYSATEIGRNLQAPVVAELPDDPQVAAMLSLGAAAPRKLSDRPLWRGLVELSSRLAAGQQPGSARRARLHPVDILAQVRTAGAPA